MTGARRDRSFGRVQGLRTYDRELPFGRIEVGKLTLNRNVDDYFAETGLVQATASVQERMLAQFEQADPAYAAGVREALDSVRKLSALC